MDKISVVMATYNGEKYILPLLESLRNQTYRIDEVIISDDTSNDTTYVLIGTYIQKHNLDWKLYKQEHNIGYIKNFAFAMGQSNGSIIFLCDQDDVWETNKVARCLAIFDNDNISCINTSFVYIDANGDKMHISDNHNNYGMLNQRITENDMAMISFDEIVFHNISMGCTMAFRSVLKDIYLENSEFQAPHDWELNMIASLFNGLAFYNQPLLQYRIHETNTVGNDKLSEPNQIFAHGRVKNAETMYVFAQSQRKYYQWMNSKNKKRSQKIKGFMKNRKDLLTYGRTSLWFRLLLEFPIYRRIVSMKGTFLDLLSSIHRRRKNT